MPLELSPSRAASPPPEPEVRVLHQDADLLVVDKPAGVAVHRGWADDDRDLLRMARAVAGRYVYPAHRLDRGASGCTVFALNEASARACGRAFADRGVHKRYLALTRGHPAAEGRLDHPIPKVPGGPRVPASTRYRCLATARRYALVEVIPETGRLHQIRRHMKHLSCPLIGDVRYGKGEHNRLFRDQYGLHRLALHAASIRLPHPASGDPLEVHAPLSGELRACLAALGLLEAAEGPSIETP
jgi:tRNA pseudouridine65 synthase